MSFKASLSVGSLGETLFFQAHEGRFERLDGRKGDFKDAVTGEIHEVKTDTYSMESTPNFFIERYSDSEKQSPGGPWQAAGNSCSHFHYLFVTNLTVFSFPIPALIERLERLLPDLEPCRVQNKDWVTIGYRVPRDALTDLATVRKFKVTLGES